MNAAIVDAGDAAKKLKSAPKFAPAGQSTQMIVGADAASDVDIVGKASTLYDRFGLRRVYYSAFSPIPDASAVLPLQRPPLMREHRLYQSDWLMRFYGFSPNEVQSAPTSRHAPARHRPEARLGAQVSRALPGRREPRAARRCCCGFRASAPRRSSASSRRGAGAAAARRRRAADPSIAKLRPFIVCRRLAADAAHRPGRPAVARRTETAAAGAVRRVTGGAAGSSPLSSSQPRRVATSEDGIDQRVGPAIVCREIPAQRGVMQRVSLRGHQQPELAHPIDDPRIVGAVERAVEILRERAARQQHDRSHDEPARNRERQAKDVEQERHRQRDEEDGRADLHEERSAAERVRTGVMVLEVIDQPLEWRDARHHAVAQREIVRALARTRIMEQPIEPDPGRARPVVHVHVGQAGQAGRRHTRPPAPPGSSASPARLRTTG